MDNKKPDFDRDIRSGVTTASQKDERNSPPQKSAPKNVEDTATGGEDAMKTEIPHEIVSDGSASAFEGTEAIVDVDAKENESRKRTPDDASGLSDY